MSAKERYGTRDLTYSDWHRTHNIKRYIGAVRAARLGMIDLDDIEYDAAGGEPLALIETAQDVGQSFKPANVTTRLGIKSGLPAYVVLYTPVGGDIAEFRRAPADDQSNWEVMTPGEYAEWLWSFRAANILESS